MARKGTSRSNAAPRPSPLSPREAERRQRAYADRRRLWAEAVGRPYKGDEDLRPPPGEVDDGPDE